MLSRVQIRLLELAARGLTTPEIADRLAVDAALVRAELAGAVRELGARSKLEAVVIAIRWGLIEPGR